MISMAEILKKQKLEDLPEEHQANLEVLLKKINKIRERYGKPMPVTSGYRSLGDHLRIYKQKGITDPKKIPMKSKHLYGQALDIADGDGSLMKWCVANKELLEEVGLWMEDGAYTKGWAHFQTVPPASGNRFYRP